MSRLRGSRGRLSVITLFLLLATWAFASVVAAAPSEVATKLAWPLAWPMTHPRLRITNYVDDYPGPFSHIDYMGGDLSYEGHRGTDFNVNSFRDMDEGVPVLAAANGRVIWVDDEHYDREKSLPPISWNFVEILHEDGTMTIYGHLRTHSVTVMAGEYVREGQIVGLMGSSGSTWMPHLHFEVLRWSVDSRGYLQYDGVRDPWSGAQNPVPSLWIHQEEYVGADHFRLLDFGVTTSLAIFDEGGIIDLSAFKERPSQPTVMGIGETYLKVWTLVYGQIGDPYAIEIHRPDGSLYTRIDASVLPGARRSGQGWQVWDVPFSGSVSASDFGVWSAEIYSGGVAVYTDAFTVGATSSYAPRFHWLAGKSFHLSQESQFDTLLTSRRGAPYADLTFSLEGAPSNVLISGVDAQGHKLVLIGPAGPDLAGVRSREFDVVATDPSGLQDRKHYHLVNYDASTLGSSPAAVAPSSVSAFEGDTLAVDVSATDPDGDAIADLSADLSGLPQGNDATFESEVNHAKGRLTWPTKSGESGEYAVTFMARTSLGGGAVVAQFGYQSIVQAGSAKTSVTILKRLAARAFTIGGDKTIRLGSDKPRCCVYLEPVNASFNLSEIDLSTVELVSEGTGSVDRISAESGKTITVGDRDRNSLPDAPFCFEKEDLRGLFDGVIGRHDLTAELQGEFTAGGRFSAEVDLDVVGGAEGEDTVRLAPNPLNPEGVLTLRLSRPGPLRVQLFDTRGRLVRALLDRSYCPAGTIAVRVDARGAEGENLASGVYLIRVSSPDGLTSTRFVVLK